MVWDYSYDILDGKGACTTIKPSEILSFAKTLALNYLLGSVYRVYTWRLEKQVLSKPRPKHIGFILDGNRRWARNKNLPTLLGHKMGYNKAKEVLDWCWEQDIQTVTVYALSLDNMRRRKMEEVNNLISLVEQAVMELTEDSRIMKRQVKIKMIGRRELLPASLLAKITKLEKMTENNAKFNLFLAVGYSGRAEIVDAVKKIVEDSKSGKISSESITEQTVSEYLYTAGTDDPDLILRTGGETRLSDFLPWQAIYSEFVFIDVPWPDFRKIDFLRAIRTYQLKDRRRGS